MFNNIGTLEVVIIAIVVMVLFGSKKLPEFTRSLATSSKEFKKALKDDDEKPKKSKSED